MFSFIYIYSTYNIYLQSTCTARHYCDHNLSIQLEWARDVNASRAFQVGNIGMFFYLNLKLYGWLLSDRLRIVTTTVYHGTTYHHFPRMCRNMHEKGSNEFYRHFGHSSLGHFLFCQLHVFFLLDLGLFLPRKPRTYENVLWHGKGPDDKPLFGP